MEADNQLAYMYAKGQYVKQDFTKAMVYIDKAIARDSADPNYIDSKGEIYLMMGQRDKAAEAWNKVVKRTRRLTGAGLIYIKSCMEYRKPNCRIPVRD